MAPEVIERVKATMVACSQQCLNAMRKEGIKVLALLSQDVDAIDKIQCSVQTARWRRILEVWRSIHAAWKSSTCGAGGQLSGGAAADALLPAVLLAPAASFPCSRGAWTQRPGSRWVAYSCCAAATRREGAAEEADASQLRS